MASVSFDGPNLLITVDPEALTQSIIDVGYVYSRWKDWVASGAGAGFPPAWDAPEGGFFVGGSQTVSFFFFRNDLGWRIEPDNRAHELVVRGNLVLADDSLATFASAPLATTTLQPESFLTFEEQRLLLEIPKLIPQIWAAASD